MCCTHHLLVLHMPCMPIVGIHLHMIFHPNCTGLPQRQLRGAQLFICKDLTAEGMQNHSGLSAPVHLGGTQCPICSSSSSSSLLGWKWGCPGCCWPAGATQCTRRSSGHTGPQPGPPASALSPQARQTGACTFGTWSQVGRRLDERYNSSSIHCVPTLTGASWIISSQKRV